MCETLTAPRSGSSIQWRGVERALPLLTEGQAKRCMAITSIAACNINIRKLIAGMWY
ncbi:MAG TPA: hypothetical protein VGQ65_04555 [Thermoanaerobaculia bacterium]|jgi:hypothetical protein|nr:hypothetical protein [Thermoanaerobaculia bacterium]